MGGAWKRSRPFLGRFTGVSTSLLVRLTGWWAAGHGHFGGLESAPDHLGFPQRHLHRPYHTRGGMGSPRGVFAPAPWWPSTARKRLNGRFWGHCVGVAGGAPRTPGDMASSGGGPSRVIYHPGQHRFWCNGGGSFRALGQGPTLLSSETPQTSSCGEAGARKISGVCRPFRDPSHLPHLPTMLN